MFFQVCFHTVFSSILEGFLVAFPGARPSIWLLFTMNSWGAPFFAKSEKVSKMSSQSQPKWLPKRFQKPSKIDQKTKPKNNTKNQRFWLLTWNQNGAKMGTQCCPEASRNGLDVNLRFVLGFGGPLGRFWAPSGHRSAILGSVWPPSGQLFGSLWKLLC